MKLHCFLRKADGQSLQHRLICIACLPLALSDSVVSCLCLRECETEAGPSLMIFHREHGSSPNTQLHNC